MKAYRYEGLSISGVPINGFVEAHDTQEAAALARERCRVVTKVEPAGAGKLSNLFSADLGAMFRNTKVKPKKLALLSSQLSIELKAGLPLVQSLHLVAENEEDKNVKKMLEDVADDVHAGHGLADSFSRRGPGLPSTFIETIRAGEASGRLDECFYRLKTYYENSAAVASKVGSAMVYPAMLIGVAIIVVAIIMIFAVPVFEDSFASMGNELPLPTKILIAISHFMTDNILLLLAVIAALASAMIVFMKSDVGRRTIALFLLKFPGIKLVNIMNAAAQFSSTLATMLSSGLPLVHAVQITAATTSNLLIAEDINNAAFGIIEGNTLTSGLKKSQWLPNLLVEMIAVGEQTGNMEETLVIVSEYYTKEVDESVKRALDILNPMITIFLAILVVFILLSVYLPIFNMYGSI